MKSKLLMALSIINTLLIYVFIILGYNAPDKSKYSIYAFISAIIVALIDGGIFTIGYYIDKK